MKINEIYDCFAKIGCCVFATIDQQYPETRIAHFLAYDEDGLYFMTSQTKPWYRQLKLTKKVSVCGLNANPHETRDQNKMPLFERGNFIRVSGDVQELTKEQLQEKAQKNEMFATCFKDTLRYPAMTTFCLHCFKGEIFDYDFEKEQRDHKLERLRFSFHNFPLQKAGLTITDKCIACGKCAQVCTFAAIIPGQKYAIDSQRCDECGNCYSVCPVQAILTKGR